MQNFTMNVSGELLYPPNENCLFTLLSSPFYNIFKMDCLNRLTNKWLCFGWNLFLLYHFTAGLQQRFFQIKCYLFFISVNSFSG